jgi:hypothetical protein
MPGRDRRARAVRGRPRLRWVRRPPAGGLRPVARRDVSRRREHDPRGAARARALRRHARRRGVDGQQDRRAAIRDRPSTSASCTRRSSGRPSSITRRAPSARSPKPLGPVYRAEDVAEAVAVCARHPRAEIHVGGSAAAASLLAMVSRPLTELAPRHLRRGRPAPPRPGSRPGDAVGAAGPAAHRAAGALTAGRSRIRKRSSSRRSPPTLGPARPGRPAVPTRLWRAQRATGPPPSAPPHRHA